MNTRTDVERWTLISAGIACAFLAASIVVYWRVSGVEQRAEVAQFSRQSDTRHARVLGELATRELALRTSAAFFESSTHVSVEEFRSYNDQQVAGGQLAAVCFNSSSGGQSMASPQSADGALCDHFDLLQPSRVVMGDEPVLLLSQFVENPTQSGSLTIAFALDSLFLDERPERMRELMVVTNSLANVAATYRFDREQGAVVEVDGLERGRPYRTYDVVGLGGVNFVYVTDPIAHSGTVSLAWVLSLVLAGLGIVTALLVGNLARTRRVVEREVQDRTAELSQFAYRTSHDLSGPLVSVAALCRAVREDVEDGVVDDVVPNLHRMEAQVERLRSVVTDILDLTQADEDQSVEPTNVAELVRDCVRDCGQTFPDHRVRFELAMQDVDAVVVSRARLHRVLDNIIGNAVKYSDPSRDVQVVGVHVQRVGRALQITVRDNGLGIAEADQPKLFDMFSRFHPSAGSGSGLGLAIVHRHVQRLGGTITVDSALGTGTTFRIHIPTRAT